MGKFVLYLSAEAEILCVQMQHGQPYLWVITDPEKPVTSWNFRVFGDEHKMTEDHLEYVDTWAQNMGDLIWHLFKVLKF